MPHSEGIPAEPVPARIEEVESLSSETAVDARVRSQALRRLEPPDVIHVGPDRKAWVVNLETYKERR